MTIVDIAKPLPALKHHLDSAFDALDAQVRRSSSAFPRGTQLFTTDATDLFDAFLSGFDDPVVRQYHNCNCCRRFLNTFGSLVAIENGKTKSFALNFGLSHVPAVFQPSVAAMQKALAKAKITGMFFSRDSALGQSRTGEWTHLWATNPSVYSSRTVTPGQHMAAKKQEFDMLRRGMTEFSSNVFEQAVVLLNTASGLTTDKFKVHATQLLALSQAIGEHPNSQAKRDIIIWRELAAHGEGFARVRSSALGTLLQDLNTGMDGAQALKAFKKVVDPLNYMVSQSAPKAGNIKRAEDIVAKLGLAPAFARRYATLDEVRNHTFWSPRGDAGQVKAAVVGTAPASAGVFAALKATPQQGAKHLNVKATMSWDRFCRTVLPTATHIALLPSGDGTYGAITAAVDPSAPPLFAWDKDDARNPYSWYRWTSTDAPSFGVNGPTNVLAVVPVPAMWGAARPAFEGVLLVTEGANDSRADMAGLGLYPQALRSDLHEVRGTISAHSAAGQLADVVGQKAAGLVLRQGATDAVLRVTTGSVALDYHIDSWS